MRKLAFLFSVFFILVVYLIVKYNGNDLLRQKEEATKRKVPGSMKITSSVFEHNKTIPSKYTCNGENINPPLEFTDVSKEAKSLVLIVDDPDAPMGTWTHWVVYNISSFVREVKEHSIPADGVEGGTSFGKPGYGGPCPPSGVHRYFFKLYALNKTLSIKGKVDKESVLEYMKDAIIDQAELIGLYSQQK
jgi:Raf kinase inhibitor-like YbhB/YbcL family protein